MAEETGLTVKIYKNIMSSEEGWTQKTRELLSRHGIVMINMIGSPGSGKTALLEALCSRIQDRHACVVLEGDVETARDAERLSSKKIRAVQIITHGACHLSARTICQVLNDLDLSGVEIVFVENVGNLVCPAEFDIGETCKMAVLSVTEGEDKPLKYPLLFQDSGAAVLTKIDLLPHLDVESEGYRASIRDVNQNLPVFDVSSKTGQGFERLEEWILGMRKRNNA